MKVWSWVIERTSDLAGVVLIGIAMFVCVDVLCRKFLASPLPGAFCYVKISLILVLTSSWALVEQRGRQVRIDYLSRRLQGKSMHLLRAATALLALVFFGLVTWQTSLDWLHSWRGHEFGYSVRIPMVIPRGELILGGALVSAELLRRFLVSVWLIFSPRGK